MAKHRRRKSGPLLTYRKRKRHTTLSINKTKPVKKPTKPKDIAFTENSDTESESEEIVFVPDETVVEKAPVIELDRALLMSTSDLAIDTSSIKSSSGSYEESPIFGEITEMGESLLSQVIDYDYGSSQVVPFEVETIMETDDTVPLGHLHNIPLHRHASEEEIFVYQSIIADENGMTESESLISEVTAIQSFRDYNINMADIQEDSEKEFEETTPERPSDPSRKKRIRPPKKSRYEFNPRHPLALSKSLMKSFDLEEFNNYIDVITQDKLLTDEDRFVISYQRRKIANRISAQLSRNRKKTEKEILLQSYADLSKKYTLLLNDFEKLKEQTAPQEGDSATELCLFCKNPKERLKRTKR